MISQHFQSQSPNSRTLSPFLLDSHKTRTHSHLITQFTSSHTPLGFIQVTCISTLSFLYYFFRFQSFHITARYVLLNHELNTTQNCCCSVWFIFIMLALYILPHLHTKCLIKCSIGLVHFMFQIMNKCSFFKLVLGVRPT